MAAPPSLLTATRVSKRYRLPGGRELLAVDDVSLSMERGGCAVLAGASGSGKSTLLSLLGGLTRPSSGEIYFDGEKLGGCSDARLAVLRRRIGFVFQNYLLLPRLPIWEGATYGLIPLGCSREARRKAAGEWLARLGLGDRLDQKPEELSGGEQQRVALARALVGDPELIVADEPTSNLDPAAADVVLALFQELLSAGKTLLLATHDPRLVALATWRGAMEQGKLRP